MQYYFVYTALLLLSNFCTGQTSRFKAQVFYKNELKKNFVIIVDGMPASTDFSGLLVTNIDAGKTQLNLQSSDKRFNIIYPRGGIALVPKDNSLVTEIILDNFENDPTLKMFNQLLQAVNKGKKEPGFDPKPLLKRLDSVEAQLVKLHFSKDEIEQLKKRQDGIDLFFPEITRTLKNYEVQALDLMNAFKYSSDFAFSNPHALQTLVQAINDYNPLIEKLMEQQALYSKRIADYWQNNSLKQEFDNLSDYILNDLHKQTILPFNELKNKLNRYFLGQMPGNKDENRISIQKEISAALPELAIKLNILTPRIQHFITAISNNSPTF